MHGVPVSALTCSDCIFEPLDSLCQRAVLPVVLLHERGGGGGGGGEEVEETLLIVGAHAPQGYSSWECLRVQFTFLHTVTNWPRRPADHLSIANDWIKTLVLFVKQPLCKATELASKLLAHLSAILFSLTSTRAYFGVWCASETGIASRRTRINSACEQESPLPTHHLSCFRASSPGSRLGLDKEPRQKRHTQPEAYVSACLVTSDPPSNLGHSNKRGHSRSRGQCVTSIIVLLSYLKTIQLSLTSVWRNTNICTLTYLGQAHPQWRVA